MTQNPYQVLGVPNGADLAECTQAYKRLAKKYHPDLNPGDRVAEAKMAEVNAAFDAIKNGNTADSTSTGSRRSADAGSDYYTAVVNFINHGQYAQRYPLVLSGRFGLYGLRRSGKGYGKHSHCREPRAK